MMEANCLQLDNAHAIGLDKVPVVSPAAFRAAVIHVVRGSARISALFGVPAQRLLSQACKNGCADKALRVFAVLSHDENARLAVVSTLVDGPIRPLRPSALRRICLSGSSTSSGAWCPKAIPG